MCPSSEKREIRDFKLKRPCENCPFRKEGGIELAPGRLQGIINTLVNDDMTTFQCHKTVYGEKTGGEWDDETGQYRPSGKESMCAGAIIYLEKAGQPTVGMRLGRALGLYDPSVLAPVYGEIIDP